MCRVALAPVRIQRGGGGGRGSGPRHLKNLKTKGFLSNTGPDLLKNHRATKPAFNVGPSTVRQRNAISLAGFGGPFLVCLFYKNINT